MKSILIVDDIKVNLKVLEVLLSRNGYNTTSALSGKDALDLLQIKPTDLIISDILMPEMDGFQFCRLCKLDENLKHIPFIFYSSTHTEATARRLAQKVGAKAFITKPADPAMLLKTIDRILDGHDFLPPEQEESMADNNPPMKVKSLQNVRQPRDQSAHPGLLKNIPCAVWTVDASGNISYISPAAEGITGFTLNYLLETGKRQWLTRVHPDDVKEVKKAYKDLYLNRIALDIEYRFECRDGVFIWLHEKSGQPYTKGNIQYVDGVSMDISEKKYLQAHRIKSRERQVMQTITKGVAQDLNTLLTGITGYIELSRMADTTPAEQEEFLTGALDVTHRASELTRQLFALSSNREPTREGAVLSEVVAAVTHDVLDNTKVQVKLDIPPDLWPCRVDPGPMAQAVANVLLNAKESLEATPFIEVILQNLSIERMEFISDITLSPGNYIKITIRDNGQGIAKDHLRRIFHPYFTTKTRNTPGQGLGLAISQAIIAQHGGFMVATSPKGAGTTMDIYLPTSKSEETAVAAPPRPPALGRVLMVDDDEMVKTITCKILERGGFQVTCVKTGTEAVNTCKEAMAAALPFSLVIVDLMTHGDNTAGITTLKQLRKIQPGLPAIASSAYPSDPVIRQYKQHGFNATVSKPYVAGELVATIREYCGE